MKKPQMLFRTLLEQLLRRKVRGAAGVSVYSAGKHAHLVSFARLIFGFFAFIRSEKRNVGIMLRSGIDPVVMTASTRGARSIS